jgi:predicted metal-dependent peptidase
MNLSDLQDELATDCVSLLRNNPYYGHVMVSVIKEFNSDLPAAAAVGCNPRPTLFINPELYFNEGDVKRKLEHRLGILEHELLHIVLKHLIRLRKLPNRQKANIAADMVCNQLIDESKRVPWLILPKKFRLPDNLTAEDYYDLLTDDMCSKCGGMSCDVHIFVDGTDGDGNENSEGMSEGTSDALAETIIDELLRQAEKRNQGNVPSNIKDLIKFRVVKTVDWRTQLRRFIGNSSRSGLNWTKKKESRRFYTRPGTKLDFKSCIVLAIDSSGSISDYELDVFCTEVDKIHKTGMVDIYTVICDADIHEVIYPYKKITKVSGRGGTDFRPIFDWVKDNSKHQSLSGLIYLTDGYGQFPDKRPSIKTLWVATHDSDVKFPFGQVIKLPELKQK